MGAISGLICMLFLGSALGIAAETARENSVRLTLRECIMKALDNNLEISIQRLSPQLDAAAILQALGEFDPALVFTPNYEENKTPLDAQSAVAAGGRLATKSRTSSLATSVQGKIPFGTSYDFGMRTSDGQNTFNSFRDQYTTFWGLTLTQPLLKGFGTDQQLTTIRIAKKQKEMSDEAFALKVMDIVTRIKSAYYNLVFAIENRRVQLQALDLAAKLLEDNRKRVQIGVMAAIEATQAESGVAGREEDVILANQEVSLRTNELRSLISQNISDLRDSLLLPADSPAETPVPSSSLEEIIAQAMSDRPDYRQAKLAIEQRHLQVKYDEKQKYPQVDLKGSYGFNGIGHDFPESVSAENDRWAVGVAVRIPLPDQAAQGRLETARLQKEKALLQLKQIEQTILVDVDNALENVLSSHKRIRATRTATRAAEESLTAESTKLKTGTTTSFVLLELQKKLADARSREIRALADYNIALAQLQRAAGATLRENDIELVK
ncbi:MAG: TolC family protein [Verrucomicrobia bacterium]|nr:TolC family protein [Verrucomicrobiota bacterium]